MKTIIAGSRTIIDELFVMKLIDKITTEFNLDITEVVSGRASGVDKIGEKWADIHMIPVKKMPAPWARFKKGAGTIRNKAMVAYADCAIVIWDGVSSGLKDTIELAKLRDNFRIIVAKTTGDINEL